MTVECLPAFNSDFADLSKQLGLFDSMEPFTEDELAMLENGAFDLLPLPGATAPALVPDLGAGWPSEAAAGGLDGSPGSAGGASSGTSFIKLEDLHAAQLQQQLASSSPASSGSQTSCYAPSCEGASSDVTDSLTTPPAKKDPRIGKRKPDVDLSSISDPAERRKQRRLAKNRATAATSRERKRRQLTELQQRVAKLEADNAAMAKLLARRDSEVAALKAASAPARPMH